MRAIRGAICLSRDDADEMSEAVAEMLREMLQRNGLTADEVVSVVLTSTSDLRSAFPAAGARAAGFTDIPLLCAQELDIAGALPRVVRAMMHVETGTPRSAIKHVYLRGAEVLRTDIAQ